MSFQEKQAIASVFSTVLASIVYFRDVFNRLVEGGPSLASDLRFWGTVFLIYIPVFIVFNIVIHIIVSILNTVATREQEPAITDELDRMVAFRADRNFFTVFGAGFMLDAGAGGRTASVCDVHRDALHDPDRRSHRGCLAVHPLPEGVLG
ncbi:MAG: hypothetical protein IPK52_19780 [Chloroflexi bacterium]|nr:hypothetical protein [Chloroflexota bacterium]